MTEKERELTEGLVASLREERRQHYRWLIGTAVGVLVAMLSVVGYFTRSALATELGPHLKPIVAQVEDHERRLGYVEQTRYTPADAMRTVETLAALREQIARLTESTVNLQRTVDDLNRDIRELRTERKHGSQ